MTPVSGALTGIRVLDLSRVLAGPFATQLLADLGAEVIKVEDPRRGDETRSWGPPFAKGESAYFLSANRGKKSIAVNLKAPEGQALVRELAAASDVLIENFKAGDLARYGLSWEDLRPVNPRLVYCSITGFGHQGPRSRMAGYDFAIQAMCGIMAATGVPEGEPMKVGVAWVDVLTGLYAAVAILAALRARDETGQGQHIDLALYDTGVAAMANVGQAFLTSGKVPARYGNAHPQIVPYQLFRTQDGWLVLAVGNDQQFRRFCEAAGRPELADDPQYATNDQRVIHRREVVETVAQLLAQRGTAQWVERLTELGVPAAPVMDIGQALADPQARSRRLVWEVDHPTLGLTALLGSPLQHMSLTPARPAGPPPLLGEHTESVLREVLGYAEDGIAELRQAGAIGGPAGAAGGPPAAAERPTGTGRGPASATGEAG